MKPVYKVKKKAEGVLDTVIEKSNFTAEFTVGEIKTNIEQLKKMKIELVSKAKLDDATVKNILGTNPEIGKIDERMMQVYYVYHKANMFVKDVQDKIKEIDQVIEEETKSLEDIIKQTGIKIDE